MCNAKSLTRGINKLPFKVFFRRISNRVHEKVQHAKLVANLGEKGTNVGVAGDITGKDERITQRCCKFTHICLKALVLVEERGHDGLEVADAGVHFNPNMALDIMSLTAAGMLLFWVALSTWRIYF